jgi:hypothetical protein
MILTAESEKPWKAGVDTLRVQARAPVDEEYLFFHRASRTLVVCDLLFNLPAPERSWTRFWRRMNRVDDGLAMSRMVRLVFNKASTQETLDQIRKLNPDNLIMAHGLPITGGATERIMAAKGAPEPQL